MPSYEIRYLTSEGELALIHKTRHEDDDAVGRVAFRMLVGSGFADYEIWREDESSQERDNQARRRILKSTLRLI
ncbi:MAG TPA: hypothetical protein VKR31_10740 [Rhizomicrobium sp.]|nr:hypothetical protein [Rhizomicrobium sp.]